MADLNNTDFHLPYDRNLVERAKELRKNATPAEQKLWDEYLKNFPYRVLRQRAIAYFIVDFYCSKLKLVIEVDGAQHFTDEGIAYDDKRTEILEGYGLKVIRFSNDEILNNFEGVCWIINQEIPPSPP
jgi:very-short-patch-repair endonuclease